MVARGVSRVLLLVIGAAVGLALLSDAATYKLMPADPGRGRERGCFTLADQALGLSRPSEATRLIEGVVGGTLLVLPFVAIRLWFRERRSAV